MAALPFLVDLVETAADAVRSTVLDLLRELASLGEVGGARVDPGWAPAWTAAFGRLSRSAYDAGLWDLLVEAAPTVGPDAASIPDAASDPGSRLIGLLVRAGRGSAPDGDVGVAVAALCDPAVGALRRTPGGHDGLITVGVVAEVFDRRDAHRALIHGVRDDPSSRVRDVLHLAHLGAVRWPSLSDDLMTVAVDALVRSDADRSTALYLLGGLGPSASEHADLVAEHGPALDPRDVEHRRRRDYTTWALARMRDDRALPRLLALCEDERNCFGSTRIHRTFPSARRCLPTLGELIERSARWAAELLPAVRGRLRRLDVRHDRDGRDLVAALGEWGPAASEAGPDMADVVRRLRLDASLLDAVVAVRPDPVVLADFPSATDRDRRRLALARHLLAGDERDLRALIDRAFAEARHRDAATLAATAGLVDDHEDALTVLLSHEAERTRVAAAAALADRSDAAVAVLASFVATASPGRELVPVMDRLAAAGPRARPAVPVVREILDRDERLTREHGWRRFVEDEEFRAAGERVIRAVRDGV